jgi:hypothetical protein
MLKETFALPWMCAAITDHHTHETGVRVFAADLADLGDFGWRISDFGKWMAGLGWRILE